MPTHCNCADEFHSSEINVISSVYITRYATLVNLYPTSCIRKSIFFLVSRFLISGIFCRILVKMHFILITEV